jgi:ribosome recycling factor
MHSLKEKMDKTLTSVKSHLAVIRTGRASPEILNKIQVNYYGSFVPLRQVANISVPEPMILMLNIFDKNAVKDIEKAIITSDLNLNPNVDGCIIRLRLPDLTETRRQDLVKIVKKYAEDGKIALRNIRRDFVETQKKKEKEKEISEDNLKKILEEAQEITNKHIQKIEELTKEKESEILTV